MLYLAAGPADPYEPGMLPTAVIPLEHPPRLAVPGSLGWGPHGSQGRHRVRAFSFWALHAITYEGRWTIRGTSVPLRPGTLLLTPPGEATVFDFAGPGAHFYLHVHLTAGRGPLVPLAVDAGPRLTEVLRRLEEAKTIGATQPDYQTALLWTLLWTYADVAGAMPRQVPEGDLAERAREVLERRFHEPPRLTDLAADLGVTSRHLLRCFQDRFGCSIRDWREDRRKEKLQELLTTTDLPATEVARLVGLKSLSQLHATCKRLLGASPTQLRQGR